MCWGREGEHTANQKICVVDIQVYPDKSIKVKRQKFCVKIYLYNVSKADFTLASGSFFNTKHVVVLLVARIHFIIKYMIFTKYQI